MLKMIVNSSTPKRGFLGRWSGRGIGSVHALVAGTHRNPRPKTRSRAHRSRGGNAALPADRGVGLQHRERRAAHREAAFAELPRVSRAARRLPSALPVDEPPRNEPARSRDVRRSRAHGPRRVRSPGDADGSRRLLVVASPSSFLSPSTRTPRRSSPGTPAVVSPDGELEVVVWINEIGERVESFPRFLELVLDMLHADLEERSARTAHRSEPRAVASRGRSEPPRSPAAGARIRRLDPESRTPGDVFYRGLRMTQPSPVDGLQAGDHGVLSEDHDGSPPTAAVPRARASRLRRDGRGLPRRERRPSRDSRRTSPSSAFSPRTSARRSDSSRCSSTRRPLRALVALERRAGLRHRRRRQRLLHRHGVRRRSRSQGRHRVPEEGEQGPSPSKRRASSP